MSEEKDDGPDRRHTPLLGWLKSRLLREVADFHALLVEHCDQEHGENLFPAREVQIVCSLRDAGLLADILHPRVSEALPLEDSQGRLRDAQTPFFSFLFVHDTNIYHD